MVSCGRTSAEGVAQAPSARVAETAPAPKCRRVTKGRRLSTSNGYHGDHGEETPLSAFDPKRKLRRHLALPESGSSLLLAMRPLQHPISFRGHAPPLPIFLKRCRRRHTPRTQFSAGDAKAEGQRACLSIRRRKLGRYHPDVVGGLSYVFSIRGWRPTHLRGCSLWRHPPGWRNAFRRCQATTMVSSSDGARSSKIEA